MNTNSKAYVENKFASQDVKDEIVFLNKSIIVFSLIEGPSLIDDPLLSRNIRWDPYDFLH